MHVLFQSHYPFYKVRQDEDVCFMHMSVKCEQVKPVNVSIRIEQVKSVTDSTAKSVVPKNM